ncbi:MAG: ABC transporter ATP-binding protein, partial [Ramlibacter sp.]
MSILWKYLRPQRKLAFLALLLAGISQVLALVDPIILGWLVDDYANQRGSRSDAQLMRGALGLLALAVAVAIASRGTRAVQEYLTRVVVQRFGTQIFNDGLRQTLR